MLSSFVERCDGETRDIDRARCRATTAYLRQTLPQRTFAFTTDEPGVVAVSDYDASVKGYHVALAGCVACTNPITIGKAKEPRLVTLKVPDKDADSLIKAVSLSRNTFGFDSLADAKRWLDTERPFLRAEFLFQPQIVGDDWTFGANRGVALKLVGRARLQPLHGRRAGVEAAVDGLGRPPGARATRTRPAGPAERGGAKRSPRRRPRATICRRS